MSKTNTGQETEAYYAFLKWRTQSNLHCKCSITVSDRSRVVGAFILYQLRDVDITFQSCSSVFEMAGCNSRKSVFISCCIHEIKISIFGFCTPRIMRRMTFEPCVYLLLQITVKNARALPVFATLIYYT